LAEQALDAMAAAGVTYLDVNLPDMSDASTPSFSDSYVGVLRAVTDLEAAAYRLAESRLSDGPDAWARRLAWTVYGLGSFAREAAEVLVSSYAAQAREQSPATILETMVAAGRDSQGIKDRQRILNEVAGSVRPSIDAALAAGAWDDVLRLVAATNRIESLDRDQRGRTEMAVLNHVVPMIQAIAPEQDGYRPRDQRLALILLGLVRDTGHNIHADMVSAALGHTRWSSYRSYGNFRSDNLRLRETPVVLAPE